MDHASIAEWSTLFAVEAGAIYWLVPGFVFSFVAGILSAWVLLVEILR
jgi:hypothetical protein